MDNFSIHVAPLPRLFPAGMPIRTIGGVPRKTDWVRRTFDTMNFSFILRGEGDYHLGSKHYPVQAPCVITQWPGLFVEYGPKETWEELYLIFPPDCLPELQRRNFARPEAPVWRIGNPKEAWRTVADLLACLKAPAVPGAADRIDRLCEMLVLQSYARDDTDPGGDPRAAAVRAVRAMVEENCAENLDFDELALENGMSPSTFRRQWEKLVGMPPGQYLIQARIRAACRLLAETELPIGEVARAVGFGDPLYFSRKFGAAVGSTATAYRRENRAAIPR